MKKKRLVLTFLPGVVIMVALATQVSSCDSGPIVGGSTDDGGVQDAGPDMANQGCGLVTCASLNANCGQIGDGCGNTITCGSCTSPQTCGGGGTQFQCGGNMGCVPMTQAQACGSLNANCGDVADGCGGTVTCGMCTAPQTCGGGGTAFQCGSGGGGPCTPLTCAGLGYNCGQTGDGCGGTLTCGAMAGACPTGQTCGGGGVAGTCGSATCTPLTCAQANANCGYVGDGCGGIIGGVGGPGCGTCTSPMICGGAGVASQCGTPMAPCVNLCQNQMGNAACTAAGMPTTTFTGTVTAPGYDNTKNWGTPDPIPNALVYVPNSAIQAISPGVACDQCGKDISGSPLVSTFTAVDGTFSLNNLPCGNMVPGGVVPLVIQLGRWRRVVNIPAPACCSTTALTNAQTHLPRIQTATDNIPAIAIVTGSADPMECILPKMGLDPTMFGDPSSATARVNFYQASTAGAGATFSGKTPKDTALWGSLTTMKQYDLIIIDCEGAAYDKSAYYNNVISYTSAGGRIYTSHYGYSFLHGQNQNPPPAINTTFDATATWQVGQGNPPNQTAFIDQTFPRGMTFATWVKNVTGGTLGQIAVQNLRHDFNAVAGPPTSQQWMYYTNPSKNPLHYTFNTPVGVPAASQCGRVMFSDFHVSTGASGTGTFPGECNLGTGVKMTAQEKVLEFMLFDLTSCITPPNTMCTPKKCSDFGYNCGLQGDGCGGVLNCGTCTAPQVCGGSGVPGVCGSGCTGKTCAQLGYNCGPAGDGCGNLIQCGNCTAPATCGGGGAGKCGTGMCTPATCASLKLSCGNTGDGCGGTLNCGTCPTGQSCGGGGTPGVCGMPNCTPRTCASVNATCGPIGDGCGNTVNCGTCPTGQTCGLFVANQCGIVG